MTTTMDDDWLVFQLADSAFPAGGFAHSGGLEATVQHNWASDMDALEGVIRCQLQSVAYLAAPFVAAAHRQPEKFQAIDDFCDASLNNHIANRASRAQGQAFVLAVSRIFVDSGPAALTGRLRICRSPKHFAPVYGAVAQSLGLGLNRSITLFLFSQLRGLTSAAVRLGIAGPMEGQALQHRLGSFTDGLVAPAMQGRIDDAVQTAPLFELLQGTHDRLYSRLFQS